MYVRVPLFFDFSDINLNTLKIRTHSLRPWKIGVPSGKNLFWCLILSYLKSCYEFEPLNELYVNFKRNNKYAAEKELDFSSIDDYIKKYNPFLNRYDCFHKAELITLVKMLEWSICSYIRNKGNEMFENSHVNRETILQAASLILKCKIYEVREGKNYDNFSVPGKETEINVYPKADIPGISSWDRELTLYYNNTEYSGVSKFSFGMSKGNGNDLQKEAFRKILQGVVSKDCVRRNGSVTDLLSIDGAKVNFVVALIKNNYLKIIHTLYKGSHRNLRKLSEAGFVIDPTCEESPDNEEFNAFYHILCVEDIEALYLFYKYATNAPQNGMISLRNPNSTTVDRLQQLRESLLEAHDLYKSNPLKNNTSSENMNELIELHTFQVQVYKEILKIGQEINYLERIPDDDFEIDKRKRIVYNILNEYSQRMCTDMFHKAEDTSSSKDGVKLKLKLDRYIKYITYYQQLDESTALFFFDHAFSLKQKLRLDDGYYEKIESAFARFIVISKDNSLERKKRKGKEIKFFSMLDYLPRKDFEDDIIKFQKHIQSVTVQVKNTKEDIEMQDVYTLTTEPIIRDNVYLSRLAFYIDTALETNRMINYESVFVIERTFQVLGESVKDAILEETFEEVTLAKSLILSSMPEETLKILRKIRNELCNQKINPTLIESRLKMEEDNKYFEELKATLMSIKSSLKHIFKLQEFQIKEYICENRLKAIKSYDKSDKKEMKKQFKNWENDLKSNLKLIKRDIKKILEKNMGIFQNHFNKHFRSINTSAQKSAFNEVQHRCKCLKLLLKLFAKYIREKISSERLLDKIENLDICTVNDENIQKKMEDFRTLKSNITTSMGIKNLTPAKTSENDVNTDILQKFLNAITSPSHVLTTKEKEDILSSVPSKPKERHGILTEILTSLKDGPKLSESKLVLQLKSIGIKGKKLRKLSKIYNSENSHDQFKEKIIDTFGTLKQKLDENLMGFNFYETICKEYDLPEKAMTSLKKILVWKNMPEDKCLKFLHKRLLIIKKIVIENHSHINYMWKTAKSPKTKQYIHDEIVQLYIQRPNLRAAVELLFFDCMVVLKKDKTTNLEYLWRKTNRLFSGINMRNMLAHGNPLFEVVTACLDPEDLPNEIVRKVIELIGYIKAIDAICKIRRDTMKSPKDIINLVNADCPQYREDIDIIKECDKWQEFVFLILPKESYSY